jgi:DNA repair exonuclease SbcCD ATPase subunit
MEAINNLNNLITHQNYLVKLLTKKDSFIRKTLLTKNLTFLNQRLKQYLIALGLPHKVEFTHEMTANISQFGRELDFGNLSSGQKARVNLALSFSFRDVLQKSHDSINVCMLDEVLDVGLDSVGVQNAARMLKRKSRDEDLALFIISHRDEVSNIFDRRMIVQMEKGFSSVKVED